MLTYTVFCDHMTSTKPDRPPQACPRWIGETTDGIKEVRVIAKASGWVRRGGLDLCPAHKDCTHG